MISHCAGIDRLFFESPTLCAIMFAVWEVQLRTDDVVIAEKTNTLAHMDMYTSHTKYFDCRPLMKSSACVTLSVLGLMWMFMMKLDTHICE